MSPSKAQNAGPTDNVARSLIFTKDTTTPTIKISAIAQGSMRSAQRIAVNMEGIMPSRYRSRVMTKASNTSRAVGSNAIKASDKTPSHCISLAHKAFTASSTEMLDDIPLRESDKNGKHKLKIRNMMPASEAASVRSIENGFLVYSSCPQREHVAREPFSMVSR